MKFRTSLLRLPVDFNRFGGACTRGAALLSLVVLTCTADAGATTREVYYPAVSYTWSGGATGNWANVGSWSRSWPFPTVVISTAEPAEEPATETNITPYGWPDVREMTPANVWPPLRTVSFATIDGGSQVQLKTRVEVADLTLAGNSSLIFSGESLTLDRRMSHSGPADGVVSIATGSKLALDRNGYNPSLRFRQDYVLNGGGTLELDPSGTTRPSMQGEVTLTNSGNTISGQGSVEITNLINRGLIQAKGGTLDIFNTAIDNTGGVFAAEANATLLFYGNTVLSGGTLRGPLSGAQNGRLGGAGSSSTIKDLSIQGKLKIPTDFIRMEGEISNSGSVILAAENSINGSVDSGLRVSAGKSATLSGNGEIFLANNANATIEGDGSLTNQGNHTIRGGGRIKVKTLKNSATIRADEGYISLDGTNVDNTGGVVAMTESGILRFMGGSVLSGGVLSGVAGGTFCTYDTGTIRDLSIQGDLAVRSGFTRMEGIISNSGKVKIGAGDYNNINGLEVYAGKSALLTGNGEIVLEHENFATIRGAGALAHQVSHTIRGTGRIRVANFANSATIRAEGGILTFNESTIDNTGGTIIAAADGTLLLSWNSIVSGGTISGVAGGRLCSEVYNNCTIKDLSLTGNLTVPSGFLSLEGTIANSGVLNIGNPASPQSFGLQVSSGKTATLTGGGEVVLGHQAYGYISGGGDLTNQESHTIRGKGEISVRNLNNFGTIHAEGGTLILSSELIFQQRGTLSCASDARLQVNTASFMPLVQFGSLRVDGIMEKNQSVSISPYEVEMSGSGIVDIPLNLVNATVNPGSGTGMLSKGALSLKGHAAILHTTLRTEIGGTRRGVDYDTIQHIGNLKLIAGKLAVSFVDGFEATVSPADTFVIYSSGTGFQNFSASQQPALPYGQYSGVKGAISGSFENVESGARLQTEDGAGSFIVTITEDQIMLSQFQPTPTQDLTKANALTDGDNDGIPAVVEYLLGENNATGLLPGNSTMTGAALLNLQAGLEVNPADTYRVFKFRVRRDRLGIQVRPEASADMVFGGSPSMQARQVGPAVTDGEYDIIQVVVLPAGGGAPPATAFVRLVVDFSSLP